MSAELPQFPHCDTSVLHRPTECAFCDRHPEWQELRVAWGIAFTGQVPAHHQVPCPSDQLRGRHGAHGWKGNRPTNVDVPVEETAAISPEPAAGTKPRMHQPQCTQCHQFTANLVPDHAPSRSAALNWWRSLRAPMRPMCEDCTKIKNHRRGAP